MADERSSVTNPRRRLVPELRLPLPIRSPMHGADRAPRDGIQWTANPSQKAQAHTTAHDATSVSALSGWRHRFETWFGAIRSPRTGTSPQRTKPSTSLEWILQQLIEAEATAFIGAARHERSEPAPHSATGTDRFTVHTGRRCRAGDPEAPVKAASSPSLLDRRRRIDRAFTRGDGGLRPRRQPTPAKVDDLVKSLDVASGIFKSEGVKDMRSSSTEISRRSAPPSTTTTWFETGVRTIQPCCSDGDAVLR